ncbi:hypothetical protein TSAR_006813, partial [Trichomalopsis sarcophagae]
KALKANSLRFANQIAARTQLQPDLPGGPYKKSTGIYYYTRDVRREVKPPITVYTANQLALSLGLSDNPQTVTDLTRSLLCVSEGHLSAERPTGRPMASTRASEAVGGVLVYALGHLRALSSAGASSVSQFSDNTRDQAKRLIDISQSSRALQLRFIFSRVTYVHNVINTVRHTLYIMYYESSQHYQPIFNLVATAGSRGYFILCNKKVTNEKNHKCPNKCRSYLQKPPCERDQTDRHVVSPHCNRIFFSQMCLLNHLKSGSFDENHTVCASLKICTRCCRMIRTLSNDTTSHICDAVFFKVCKLMQPIVHLCFMRPIAETCHQVASTTTRKQILYLFYDFETQQSEPVLEYIDEFFAEKTYASGYRPECRNDNEQAIDRYIQNFEQEEGIKLDKSRIKFNAGLRSVAKLFNSLWEKFGQRGNMTKTEIVRDPQRLFELLTSPDKVVNSILPTNDEILYISWVNNDECAGHANQ